ncbi:MAG: hypothetical protein WKG00_31035 [Polyangiaceae bacterium]
MRARFDDLPLVVRQRFVAISNAPSDPRITWFRPIGSMHGFNWFFGVVSLLGGIWALVFVVQRAFVVRPSSDSEVYLTLAGCVAVLLASVLGIVFRVIWKPPPFREGFYLTGSALVRAQGAFLDLLPLDQVGRPQITHFYRRGSYQRSRLDLGAPFSIAYSSKVDVEEGWKAVAQSIARYKAIMAARDASALAAIDPFVECTLGGQWVQPSPEPPRVPVVPVAARLARWFGALVVGAAVSGLLYVALDQVLEGERLAEQRKLRGPSTPTPTPTPTPRPRR